LPVDAMIEYLIQGPAQGRYSACFMRAGSGIVAVAAYQDYERKQRSGGEQPVPELRAAEQVQRIGPRLEQLGPQWHRNARASRIRRVLAALERELQ
jgi:hypothetical protein